MPRSTVQLSLTDYMYIASGSTYLPIPSIYLPTYLPTTYLLPTSEKSTPLALILNPVAPATAAADDEEEDGETTAGAVHCKRLSLKAVAGTTVGPKRHHRPVGR